MCLADPSKSPRPNRFLNLFLENHALVDLLSYKTNFENEKLVNKYTIRENNQSSNFFIFLRRISNALLLLLANIIKTDFFTVSLNNYRHNIFFTSKKIKQNRYDFILVEDLQLLPFALKIKNKAKVIFDAREFFPLQYEDNWFFKKLESPQMERLCKNYLKQCDKIFTVSNGLSFAFKEHYDVECEVLFSTPYFTVLPEKNRKGFNIRLVHHGVANRNRQIESMIDVVKKIDARYTLDFYLNGDKNYIDELKHLSIDCSRINFKEPVPLDGIVNMLHEYDIGFYFLKPNGFNVTYNLPNKFFEFIQANLAIVIGPSPNMEELVKFFKIGFVSDDFENTSMINLLNSITIESIEVAKQKSRQAAAILCFENESLKVLNYLKSNV